MCKIVFAAISWRGSRRANIGFFDPENNRLSFNGLRRDASYVGLTWRGVAA